MAKFEKVGNQVIFMPTWWRDILEYGARAASPSISGELAKRVTFAPTVDGQIKSYRRHYKDHGRPGSCQHEAFIPGQVIGVRAMLPDGLRAEDLERILYTAGQYKGISPYGKDALGYGRFEVLEVQPVRAAVRHQEEAPEGDDEGSDTA